MKTKRNCAGSYTVSQDRWTVTVTRFEHLKGQQWVAAAEWDRHLYTDPMWTKTDAVFTAKQMIAEQVQAIHNPA